MIILHVASINVEPNSGMGRISFEWKKAFENAGHEFKHIGLKEIGHHHALTWGYYALQYARKKNLLANVDLILVHEPVSGFFANEKTPMAIFSHGIEERAWKVQKDFGFLNLSAKSRLLPEAIRFYSHNRGFRKCKRALLSNSEDALYLKSKNIDPGKIEIFHNGYYNFNIRPKSASEGISFLYNASWIPRKGVRLMYEVFNYILDRYPDVRLNVIGTKIGHLEVMQGFQEQLRDRIKIVNSFTSEEEGSMYANTNVFVMPSFFEGQSVALTQAMALGLCPVASDNCGQKDFIKHQTNGLLFRTGNSEDFRSQLETLISNPMLIHELGENARQSVQGLRWENVADEFVKLCVNANE